MNMGPGGGSRHRASEGDKRNAHLSQVRKQRSSFITVRMNRHIYRISMIEPETFMGCGLTESGNGQRTAKGL
jgi:hypothetical protein